MKDWTLTLKNGNNVGILELGDPESDNVLFHFHGFPGCRYEVAFADKLIKKHHLRTIVPDRPGYGNSTYDPKREIRDFPNIVLETAETLGIKKFSVLGVSGGAPYAAACACLLTPYVKRAVIVSGMSPLNDLSLLKGITLPNKILLKLGVTHPQLAGLIVGIIATLWIKSAGLMHFWLRSFMSNADKQILKRKDNNTYLEKMNKEALKQGVHGARHDFKLLCKDWGFKLEDISVPVSVWHGNADCYVPLAMGKYLASHIPQATFNEIPNAGHLMIINLLDDILAQFAEDK